MKDPHLLIEPHEPSDVEAKLLALARSDGPSGDRRRRMLAGLGVAPASALPLATVGASAPSATPAAKGALPLKALKWVVLGAAAVGIPLAMYWSSSPPLATPTAVRPASAPPPRAPSSPAAPAAVAPVVSVEDLPVERPRPAHTAPTTKRDLAPSLAEEVAAIRSARQALQAGDPSGALGRTDEYQRRFPRGRLQPEATMIRIEAHLALGERDRARSLARPFLDPSSHSPYAERVRSLLGGGAAPSR